MSGDLNIDDLAEAFSNGVTKGVQNAVRETMGQSANPDAPPVDVPITTKPASNPWLIAVRVVLGLLGAFLTMASLGGFAQGDFIAAFIMTLVALSFLWLAFIKLRPRAVS